MTAFQASLLDDAPDVAVESLDRGLTRHELTDGAWVDVRSRWIRGADTLFATLRDRYAGIPVGYSGHERGLQISLAAVALGAVAVERHITLDRAMWGSDHAASLELGGLERLVRDIRVIEEALGDGVKRVYPGELAPMAKLRRVGA